MREHPKLTYTKSLRSGSKILDVGCWRYSYHAFCEQHGVSDLQHYGIDYQFQDTSPPSAYQYVMADVWTGLPFSGENFDGVVASHIYEHVPNGIALVDEILRVLKPGGVLYFECPSERSVWFPSMPFKFERFYSLNFYDDPTHVGRPISPQGLYRLFRMYQAEVLSVGYVQSKRSRLKFPWRLAKALITRDPSLLEQTVWNAWGFSVFGIAKKNICSKRRYVLR